MDRPRQTPAPRCPPDKIVIDHQLGIKVCSETGEVLAENIISDEREWHAYTPEEKHRRPRAGDIVSYAKPYLGVRAALAPPRETVGKRISRAARGVRRERVKLGRTLAEVERAVTLIVDVANRLDLPDPVKEEAARLYREAVEKGLARGRSTASLALATLYIACRKYRTAYMMGEIAEGLGVPANSDILREAFKVYRLLARALNVNLPFTGSDHFIYRIAGALNLPERVVAEALRIADAARSKGLASGKDPRGLAAAAIYLAQLKHGLNLSQHHVAGAGGITVVTLRNRYKEIKEILGGEESGSVRPLETGRRM